MNYFDYLLLAILAVSVIGGFLGGFARVGIGFIATVCGIFFGFWFYGIPASYLREHLSSRLAANLLGFFIVFLIFIFAGSLAGWALAKIFKWVRLSWLDRLLGAAFGFVRGTILLVAFVTVIMAFTPKPPPGALVNSKLLPYVVSTSGVLAALAPHELRESFHEGVRQIEKMWTDIKPKKKPERLKEEEH